MGVSITWSIRRQLGDCFTNVDPTPPHVAMKLPLLNCLALITFAFCSRALSYTSKEHFEEVLVLRPERDGRVVAGFAFKTLVSEAAPRNPETLGLDDNCGFNISINIICY